MIAGVRGEENIAELWRKAGTNQNVYYRWSKEFWRWARSGSPAIARATSDEVKGIWAQAQQLKDLPAEVLLENRLLEKNVIGDDESDT